MKLPKIRIGVAFIVLMAIFACNRNANNSASEVKSNQPNAEIEVEETDTRIDSSQNSSAADSMQTSPMRNPFANNPDTVIYLEKTACFGSCPVFSATILANGEVFYRGKENVEKIGFYTAKIDKRQIQLIDAKLLAIGFFDLAGQYPEDENNIILDFPWIYLFSELKDRQNHIAINNGAPAELLDFIDFVEHKLDDLDWNLREEKD